MECNGFDSNDYLYFRLKEKFETSGSWTSYELVELKKVYRFLKKDLIFYLFNLEFHNIYSEKFEKFDFIFQDNVPFDILQIIKMQKPLRVKYDTKMKLFFSYKEYCLINKWLKNKMDCEDLYIKSSLDSKTIKQKNDYVFSYVTQEEEKTLDYLNNLLTSSYSNIPTEPDTKMYKFKTNTPIYITLKKGELLHLNNPAIALAFLNQNFLMFLGHSEEISEQEKEKLFLEEHKDYIPGTRKKYYRVRDNVKIVNPNELERIEMGQTFEKSFCVSMLEYSKLQFYRHNPLNFNEDGSIKYFCVDYDSSFLHLEAEKEIAKFAIQLSRDEAIKKYEDDLIAEANYEKEQKALQYVKEHRARYKKGTNRNLTPVEFMESELNIARTELGMRLVKTLRKRMINLNK